MPKQELFFERQDSDRRIEVLKSYDQGYAREAFNSMSDEARKRLWSALQPEGIYDAEGLPKIGDPEDVNDEAGAFLWDELVEQAAEDPRQLPRSTSFFIVNETEGKRTQSLYVSPDWPSAEAFAKERSAAPLVS